MQELALQAHIAPTRLGETDTFFDLTERDDAQIEPVFVRFGDPLDDRSIRTSTLQQFADHIGIEQPSATHNSPSSRTAAFTLSISTSSSPARAKKLVSGSRRRCSRS